ncbi:hypothetical protein HNQ36_003669 [Afipia massiliensis]|uniref:Uncharacterized protein n=1 Tax=Afipia massiliensis TaxID=211460 RepID=A0A840MZG1_9BRAD|nr:hypothetical protein [Afipia massiliensis]MBB5053669.1 hypothetical protein [Afipia massiliensis]
MSSVDRNLNMDIHASSLLAATFSQPSEVLMNRNLSLMEKRCVLAAWASDAFAVRNNPWLRELPGSANPVPVKDILAALRQLDDGDDSGPPPLHGGAALRMPMLEEPAAAVGI